MFYATVGGVQAVFRVAQPAVFRGARGAARPAGQRLQLHGHGPRRSRHAETVGRLPEHRGGRGRQHTVRLTDPDNDRPCTYTNRSFPNRC